MMTCPQATMDALPEQKSFSDAEKFLKTTRNLLNWERKFWIAAAIALFITIGSTSYFAPYILLLLPVAIFSCIIERRIFSYLKNIDRDLQPVAKHCNSMVMLVISAIFNSIAFVFFVINFSRMRANRQLVETIIGKQCNT